MPLCDLIEPGRSRRPLLAEAGDAGETSRGLTASGRVVDADQCLTSGRKFSTTRRRARPAQQDLASLRA